MKRHLHLLLAPVALLWQTPTAGLIYLTPRLAYGGGAVLPEAWVWPLSMAWLIFFALSGLALACTASYLLLTRSHRAVAALLVAFFCVPAWSISVFHLHAALVFLAWV